LYKRASISISASTEQPDKCPIEGVRVLTTLELAIKISKRTMGQLLHQCTSINREINLFKREWLLYLSND
jgi:hypothetical protein